MERIEAFRSCSNCMLTMRFSRRRGLAGWPAPHCGEAGGARNRRPICCGRTADNACADRADHRWRPCRHVLRAVAAQLRAAPDHHREGDRVGWHGPAQPLSKRMAARAAGRTARENAEEFARHIRQRAVETWLGARPQRVARGSDGRFALDDRAFRTAGCRSHYRPRWSRSRPERRSAASNGSTGSRMRGRWRRRGRVHLGPPWAGEPGADLESHVAVIGGGDNAFDVSRMLVEKGVRATVVMRSTVPRAQPRLVARLRAHERSGKAQILAGRTVKRSTKPAQGSGSV